jgi:hypothetical protein
MQQTCQHCGREATSGRFCRSCGAPLFTENEATSAATRNYPSNQPPSVQTAPSNVPYTQADYPAPDTSRLYHPPNASAYAVPQPRKSNAALWVVLSLLCALVIGGLASLIVLTRINARKEDARRRMDAPPAFPIPPLPPAPPGPPPAAGRRVIRLEDLKYPNGTVVETVRFQGTEKLGLRTEDDFEEVIEFYQDRLGAPVKQDNDKNQATFMTSNWRTIVTINPDKQHRDQLSISIVLLNLPNIPRPDPR